MLVIDAKQNNLHVSGSDRTSIDVVGLGWVGSGCPLDPEKWCPGGVEGVGIRVSRRGYVGISAEDPPPGQGSKFLNYTALVPES